MPSKKPNRRGFLKNSAKLAGLVAGGTGVSKAADEFLNTSKPKGYMSEEEIAYGQRSRYVTSKRVPIMGRHSPDEYGLMFHVNSPLQDQIGFITPTPLFYLATHRGSYIPDIDPKEHRLMIHGMVDRPLIFTVDDIKRLPSVTRIHMIECLGNRTNAAYKTVQETHGLTSSAEWTGVELSLLLREAGVQPGASWVVAEGVEEVKGSSCFELAKAMDDCMVVYAMNGEPLRPQHGFPLRLFTPGLEGIFHIKYLRRIKLVDRYYLTYNDYGHIQADPRAAQLANQIGPKSVITYPSGGHKLQGPGFYEISGLAWSGAGAVRSVEVSTDGGQNWKMADLRSPVFRIAHTRFALSWKWDGNPCTLLSRCTDELGTRQPSREEAAKFFNDPPDRPIRVRGNDNTIQPWKVTADGSVTNGLA